MSSSCNGDCAGCKSDCDSRQETESLIEAQNTYSDIKKVIGVVSGKGGVGKSLVTALLASGVRRKAKEVAVLDADITGPSIPRLFGIKDKAKADERGLLPENSDSGIEIMSVNLLLENEEDPVVWRGPVIAGAVKQFWTDVAWGKVDYMFVDMPPGTGDVALTVFQTLPVDGIIVVTSPQELVEMIVGKAVKMAKLMDIPVIGLVENMSYFECPDCHQRHDIFGRSRAEEIAAKYGIEETARIPIDPTLAKACDAGAIEHHENDYLKELVEKIITM